MTEGLIDKRAIMQCLGSLMKNPSLLDEYSFDKEDFCEGFYCLIYSIIFNLYTSGLSVIDSFSVDSYISHFIDQYRFFNENRGLEYINNAIELSELENFSYYYERLKKFSYLRYLESKGYDTRQIYDSTIADPSKQEQEMLKLDALTVDDIIDIIDNTLVNEAKLKFSSNTKHIGQTAGKGLKTLKEALKEAPDYGMPMQSQMISTIARGCRLKKLYIRSSDSGGGKSRTGLADMANIAIPYKYNTKEKMWEYTGFNEPVLMITTELEIEEVQTILLAYVSGVNESHIREGMYDKGEEEIVDQAIQYIESSPFYIEFIPDFGIKDMVHLIKKYKREKSVYHFFLDYIHMSNQLIIEVATMSSGMRLREDQILFLFADTLKNLCNTLGVFILTSTQLNGTYKDSPVKDETMLRGAKSLADRIDMGEISLAPTEAELKIVEPIVRKLINKPTPNLVRHVYKLRAGKWSKIKIYQHVDLGTCRTVDLFALDRNNKLIDIPIINFQATSPEEHKTVENLITENSVDLHTVEEEIVTTEDKYSNLGF